DRGQSLHLRLELLHDRTQFLLLTVVIGTPVVFFADAMSASSCSLLNCPRLAFRINSFATSGSAAIASGPGSVFINVIHERCRYTSIDALASGQCRASIASRCP